MNHFLKIALAAAVGWGVGVAGVSAAKVKDVLKATHGDWQIRCIEKTQVCAMTQVGKTKAGKRALLITIQRIAGQKTKKGKAVPAAMTVQTPLGILLPYGVRVKIDKEKVIPLPLARCIPRGCIVRAPMLQQAVDKMKKGSKAVFGIFLNKEVLVNVSLKGFTKAYDNLKPVKPKRAKK